MRRINTTLKGIIRNQTEHMTPEGACEELINLRNDGGLKVVGGKLVILQNKTYSKVLEHITADFNNLIAVIANKVYLVNRTTGGQTEIHSCPTVNIELATLNNMLIINCLDATKVVVYQYKSGAYSLLFNGFPAMALVYRTELEESDTKLIESTKFVHTGVEGSTVIPLTGYALQKVKEQILSALNECRSIDPEFCEGYILVCTSYTLIDGTETKMSPPTMFKLATYDSTPIFQTTHSSGNSQDLWLKIQAERLYVEIDLPANINNYTDLIKYVNIYCTRPISYYKNTFEGITIVGDVYSLVQTTSEIGSSTFNEALFESELFYKQHRIEINKVEERYQIKFGDELLTGKLMPVDSSGWVSVVGKPFVYNNRLHLFNLKRTLIAEQEVFTNMTLAETLPAGTTTPEAPRVAIDYYSHSIVSAYDAWEQIAYPVMPVIGTLWYDAEDGDYYTAEIGGSLVDPGWYLISYGNPWTFSTILAIRIGEIVPETTDEGTTSEGTTEEGTTADNTTEESTTTTEDRVFLTNYGFHATSWEFAFLLESPGTAYFDSADNKYYSTATGSVLALEGFYVVVKGVDQHDSEYIFINEFGYGEYFYPPATTTEDNTTEEGTTLPDTTEEPPAPEPITCNGFDAFAQNDADTHILSNNYNTQYLYINYVGGVPYAYSDVDYTTFAQAGYYAVGTYALGVERRIQIGDAGVILYDSDGILTPPDTTTDEGTTEENTTTEEGATTTDEGTTEQGTTDEGTTEEDTTTLQPRSANNYYGFDADSALDCFNSNLTGTVYSDPNDNKWYTTATGSVLIADGYWMFEKGSGVEDSLIYQFLNGEIIG